MHSCIQTYAPIHTTNIYIEVLAPPTNSPLPLLPAGDRPLAALGVRGHARDALPMASKRRRAIPSGLQEVAREFPGGPKSNPGSSQTVSSSVVSSSASFFTSFFSCLIACFRAARRALNASAIRKAVRKLR